MDDTLVLVKNESLTVRELGEEILFLDPEGTSIHVADEVGGFIYHQIDGIKTLSDVLRSILSEYEVDEKTARDDLYAFIGQLIEKKILSVR